MVTALSCAEGSTCPAHGLNPFPGSFGHRCIIPLGTDKNGRLTAHLYPCRLIADCADPNSTPISWAFSAASFK